MKHCDIDNNKLFNKNDEYTADISTAPNNNNYKPVVTTSIVTGTHVIEDDERDPCDFIQVKEDTIEVRYNPNDDLSSMHEEYSKEGYGSKISPNDVRAYESPKCFASKDTNGSEDILKHPDLEQVDDILNGLNNESNEIKQDSDEKETVTRVTNSDTKPSNVMDCSEGDKSKVTSGGFKSENMIKQADFEHVDESLSGSNGLNDEKHHIAKYSNEKDAVTDIFWSSISGNPVNLIIGNKNGFNISYPMKGGCICGLLALCLFLCYYFCCCFEKVTVVGWKDIVVLSLLLLQSCCRGKMKC